LIKSIGILGYGWLGTPLGLALKDAGFTVKGTTRDTAKYENLQEQGLAPYLLEITQDGLNEKSPGFFDDLDLLIINVPPNLRRDPSANYVHKMELLLKRVEDSGIEHLIFVSSTAVYGDISGEIDEQTIPKPVTQSGKQLRRAEQLFQANAPLKATIVRFGGLLGGNRHPVKQLSGRELQNGDALVNLIHLNDCIHLLKTIITQAYWGEVFNGVYPYHPTKKEYYTAQAKKLGVPPPKYLPSPKTPLLKKIIFRNFYVKGHEFTTSIS